MKFASVAGLTGNYRIRFLDTEEPLIVRVIAADIMRWEQVNAKSFFEGTPSLTRMMWVAWAACRRQRLTDVDTPADWFKQIEDLEKEEIDDDEDSDTEEVAELPTPTEAEFPG